MDGSHWTSKKKFNKDQNAGGHLGCSSGYNFNIYKEFTSQSVNGAKIRKVESKCTGDLERVQKAAVKVILGKDYLNYEEALGELKLENLDERREAMAIKFVKKSLENSNFSKLFPLREVKHGMRVRKSEKYVVKTSKTNRHKDSAVPYLQKLLNKDYIEKRQNLKRILEIPQVVKNDRELKRKRVNYVSHVDVIT